MSCSRKILLVLIALAVLADFLPVTHEELSWWWAQSRDRSDDYLSYRGEWPNGRHVADAQRAYELRQRAEAKRAQIHQAYAMAAAASSANPKADPGYALEKAVRRDNFNWQQALHVNTVAGFSNYLEQFPQGRHANEARQKMAAPGLPTGESPPSAPN